MLQVDGGYQGDSLSSSSKIYQHFYLKISHAIRDFWRSKVGLKQTSEHFVAQNRCKLEDEDTE